jgi:hypothetical protein
LQSGAIHRRRTQLVETLGEAIAIHRSNLAEARRPPPCRRQIEDSHVPSLDQRHHRINT